MQKRRVFINAVMSATQIILIGAVLFVLYRFLLKTIGPDKLGIWSLILSTVSVTQVANFGLSGSVVKFVAKYVARDDKENVSALIQTAIISAAVFVGTAILIGYPIAKWILSMVVPDRLLSLALSIMPYALVSLWFMTVTGIIQAGMDGFQLIYLRNLILIFGSLFYLLLCFILTPRFGLIGLAFSQVIQNSVVLVFSWIICKRLLPSLPLLPYKWDRKLFKEIVSYGSNFQIVSITAMFYDPVTKTLLSRFGGLSMVGYYDMANRMIQQFRALIVTANQVLVPTFAELQEKTPERIKSMYLTSYQLLFYLALPMYSLIIISIPVISRLWIGHYESAFVIFGVLLSIGWFLNLLNAPAYFAYLGIGELNWNVIGHITIALLNAGLCLLGGIFFDGIGVVIAWTFSLALGSSLIYLSYHLKNKIALTEFLPKDSRPLFAFCLLVIMGIILINHEFRQNHSFTVVNSFIIVVFVVAVTCFLWFHPMRRRLTGWIKDELLNMK